MHLIRATAPWEEKHMILPEIEAADDDIHTELSMHVTGLHDSYVMCLFVAYSNRR